MRRQQKGSEPKEVEKVKRAQFRSMCSLEPALLDGSNFQLAQDSSMRDQAKRARQERETQQSEKELGAPCSHLLIFTDTSSSYARPIPVTVCIILIYTTVTLWFPGCPYTYLWTNFVTQWDEKEMISLTECSTMLQVSETPGSTGSDSGVILSPWLTPLGYPSSSSPTVQLVARTRSSHLPRRSRKLSHSNQGCQWSPLSRGQAQAALHLPTLIGGLLSQVNNCRLLRLTPQCYYTYTLQSLHLR